MMPLCALFHCFQTFYVLPVWATQSSMSSLRFARFCHFHSRHPGPGILAIYLPVGIFPFWWPYSCTMAHTVNWRRYFLFAFLAVRLTANTVLVLCSLSQHWPLRSLPFSISFGSISGWWSISKPHVSQKSWPFRGSLQSNGCLFGGGVSCLGNWGISSMPEAQPPLLPYPGHKGFQIGTTLCAFFFFF